MSMNGLYLVLISALVLSLCYRFYGAFIAAKVLALDGKRPTPAVVHEDGHDYVPTNKWVLFGHHFAAIAGAGPLVGPVLAAQFGYLPSMLWILIGACLGGAVHDMIILFASIRHDGKSIAEIAKEEIGQSAGLAAAIAVIFILVITMAGMGIAVANALFNSPWGAFTVGATIPIALFIGVYMRYLRPGHIGEASFVGVVLVIAAVVGGAWIQHSSWAPFFTLSRVQLDIILPLYGFVAAACMAVVGASRLLEHLHENRHHRCVGLGDYHCAAADSYACRDFVHQRRRPGCARSGLAFCLHYRGLRRYFRLPFGYCNRYDTENAD